MEESSWTERRVSGRPAMLLASELLHRVRTADPYAGFWEAADVQWWWRRPRASDAVDQLFWVDDRGPAAMVLLTAWREDQWQCDPVVAPGVAGLGLPTVWAHAVRQVERWAVGTVEVPVRDDDHELRSLVQASGLTGGEVSGLAWMDVDDRLGVQPMPAGFVLADRRHSLDQPHPMRQRSGDQIGQRLTQCPLYDPELDLAVQTTDGEPAGYALFWFDPVTEVGFVEPVRIHDAFQRRGLARAMITEGLDRLARRGARRLKIGFGTEAASSLYQSLGFRPTSTDTFYDGAVSALLGPTG